MYFVKKKDVLVLVICLTIWIPLTLCETHEASNSTISNEKHFTVHLIVEFTSTDGNGSSSELPRYNITVQMANSNMSTADVLKTIQIFENKTISTLTLNEITLTASDTFGKFPNVHRLNINWMSSKSVLNEHFLPQTTTLRVLYLIESKNLTSLPSTTFTELPELEELYLNGNQLKLIQPELLNSLKELKYLDLSHNYLAKIDLHAFNDLISVWNLNLSYNQLTNIEDKLFFNMTELRSLDLSHNHLMRIEIGFHDSNGDLENFDLSSNRIASFNVTFKNSKKVQLDLRDNLLKELDSDVFFELNNNTELFLKGNPLTCESVQKLIEKKVNNYDYFNCYHIIFIRIYTIVFSIALIGAIASAAYLYIQHQRKKRF